MSSRVQFLSHRLRSAAPFAVSRSALSVDRGVNLDPEGCNLAGVNRSLKLVLLSSDDRLCILVRSYLQHLGFCVFTCAGVDRAERRFLERRDIELWLVDVETLGIEAMYLAARVREVHSEVPIILISGLEQTDSDVQRCMWQNWIRLRKPIQLPDLLAAIHRALTTVSGTSMLKKQHRNRNSFESEWMNRFLKLGTHNHLLN